MKGLLGLLGQRRKLQVRGREHVGHVRARAAGDRVDADSRLTLLLGPRGHRVGLGAREGCRDLEQLVEAVDAGHAELAEHRVGDRVGPGEVARVALGHRAAGLGAADLHHHDRLLQLRGVIRGEHQRAAVLEAFDVAGDDADLVLVGEVAGEVGELEVDLVAGRRPVRETDAELLALEDRATLVAGLGHERDRRTFEVVTEALERVEVRVRPEEAHIAALDQLGQARLELLAVLARLREAGGEDDRELGLAGEHLFEGVDGPAGEDDREVDVAGDVEDGRVDLVAEDRLVVRVDGVEGGAVRLRPGVELPGHGGVGLPGCL